MIARDPAAAAHAPYDLIVVGGGIQGIATTLEAARRGLRVLLLERSDFGGETSWNSLRILHGGLRYLQTFDLRRYRESVAERHWFMSSFPELVTTLPCLMPLYGGGLKRPAVLGAALRLDDWLSRGRNRDLPAELRLEAGRTVGVDETAQLFSGVERNGLRGAAIWNDALMPESPRVAIEMLHWATACGATALNYCPVDRLSVTDARVAGVTATDQLTGDSIAFRAPRVINCSGPWSRELAATLDRDRPELYRPSLAFNLLLDCEPPSRLAVALSSPDGSRSYFLVPWSGRLLAGTFHGPADSHGDLEPDDPRVSDFLDDLNGALPALALDPSRVLRVLAGTLPAAPGDPGKPASSATVHVHSSSGGPRGLVTVASPKYTTARSVAERSLAVAFEGKALPSLGSTGRPAGESWPSADEIETAAPDDTRLAMRLAALAERESVVHLDDLLLRRTDLGLDPQRGAQVRERLASLLSASPLRLEPPE